MTFPCFYVLNVSVYLCASVPVCAVENVIPVDVSNVQSKAGCVHCHEDGGIGIWES